MADIKQCLYSLKEAAAALIRDQGLTEGHFELLVEFNVGIGNVAVSHESVSPSAIIGVQRIGLSEVLSPTPNSVNAAQINPKTKQKSSTKKSATKS